MSESNYRPWRRDLDAADLLASESAAQWRDLLEQTRQGVSDLRELNLETEARLRAAHGVIDTMDAIESNPGIGAGADQDLGRRFDKIEARLALLERAMGQLVSHMPRQEATKQKESPVQPFEHLLGSLRSDAA
ncbi:MAG: hypothetical protein ACYTGQ_05440 [Planctomycetota bacterium]|jgi:hypothetical protein